MLIDEICVPPPPPLPLNITLYLAAAGSGVRTHTPGPMSHELMRVTRSCSTQQTAYLPPRGPCKTSTLRDSKVSIPDGMICAGGSRKPDEPVSRSSYVYANLTFTCPYAKSTLDPLAM